MATKKQTAQDWSDVIKTWAPLVLTLLTIIGVAVEGRGWIDEKFSTLGRDMQGKHDVFNTRLTKIEDSLRLLASDRNSKTKSLIQQFLSSAKTKAVNGKITDAVTDTEAATNLIQLQKDFRAPASDQFFLTSYDTLASQSQFTNASLSEYSAKAMMSLASYKSALNPIPELTPTKSLNASYRFNDSMILHNNPIASDGAVLDVRAIPAGHDIFDRGDSTIQIPIKGLVLWGAEQTLDGFDWSEVTFVGTSIKYNGGTTNLKNVKFIDCTFDVPPTSDKGVKLLAFALKGEKQLQLLR